MNYYMTSGTAKNYMNNGLVEPSVNISLDKKHHIVYTDFCKNVCIVGIHILRKNPKK